MSNIPVFSVSELSHLIKKKLENDFSYIQIKGEISDLKLWNGHFLFNLKDHKGVIAARIWSNRVPFLSFKPEEGLEITATGKISTHVAKSSYNLIIDNIRATSEGEFLKLIEFRKRKLKEEGIFKKSQALPLLPDKIGIVTSLTGAVIEDIKNKISIKFPCHLLIYPISVQGNRAEEDLVNAIRLLNTIKKKNAPDVIIIARGGGSVEDLMPFNSEKLAYEIFNSKIPIISAVGHETDFSISDFAADFRASTPTAAADMVVPEKKELEKKIYNYSKNMHIFFKQRIENKNTSLQQTYLRVTHPRKLIDINKKKLRERFLHFLRLNTFKINEKENRLNLFSLKNPISLVFGAEKILKKTKNNINNTIFLFLKNKTQILESNSKVLDTSSYQKWLEKGFAILKNNNNKIIKNAEKLNVGEEIKIKLFKGDVNAKVSRIKKN